MNYVLCGFYCVYCLLLRYVEIVVNDFVGVVRCGLAFVLGGFFVISFFVAKNSEDKSVILCVVIMVLLVVMKLEEDVEMRDVEMWVNVMISFLELSVKLMCVECYDIDDDDIVFVLDIVIVILFGCLCDYSVDNCGDVGLWV